MVLLTLIGEDDGWGRRGGKGERRGEQGEGRVGHGPRITGGDGGRGWKAAWIMDQGSDCLNIVQIDVMKITSILVTESYFSVFRKKSGG